MKEEFDLKEILYANNMPIHIPKTKIKIITEFIYHALEKSINEFIEDKDLLSIDYKPVDGGICSALIVYKE